MLCKKCNTEMIYLEILDAAHCPKYCDDDDGVSNEVVVEVVSNHSLIFLYNKEHLHSLSEAYPYMDSLYIGFTYFDDNDMEYLEDLSNLKYLSLQNTKITDTGLESLEGLNNTKYIALNYTQVTDAGVSKLKLALPDCTIYA